MLILLKIFEKISILVTISKILDFPQMFGNLNIGQRFKKNLSFGKIFRKYCFLSAFRESISILVKIFEPRDCG